jgi:hypothetical protein
MDDDVDEGHVGNGATIPEGRSCVVYSARVITVSSLIRSPAGIGASPSPLPLPKHSGRNAW